MDILNGPEEEQKKKRDEIFPLALVFSCDSLPQLCVFAACFFSNTGELVVGRWDDEEGGDRLQADSAHFTSLPRRWGMLKMLISGEASWILTTR